MHDQLLAAMVARAAELCKPLARLTQQDPSFADLEALALDISRAIGAALLALATTASTPPVAGPCPACRAAGRDAVVRHRSRTLLTRCGPITLSRAHRTCRRCGHTQLPLDVALGLAPGVRMSEALRGLVVEHGGRLSFRDAADLLADSTGIVLGAETVRTHTEAAGQALRAAEDEAVQTAARTREPVDALDPPPGHLTAEVDGTMVRYLDGWHEAKVGAIGGWTGARLEAVSYVARRATPAEFGAVLGVEAARRGAWEVVGWTGPVTGRGLAILPETLVLGDGAAWIWTVAAEQFGRRVEILDFFHACEHLSTVATASFGERNDAGRAWAARMRTTLKEQGVGPVLAALRRLRPPTPEAAETLRVERGYFTKNADRMDYPALRTAGRPVGSGAVESAAKHVVQQRMKRAGMRWSDAGGDAMLALCARVASERPLLQAA
ncbi:MAG: ISKra4 family transposase [Dehalococcoidia bacterium]